jgi:hypothetical protein
MKKLMIAVVAGLLSVAVAGAYAGESKGDAMKSDTGMAKSEKGTAKKDAATTKDDDKKKGKRKKDESTTPTK